MQPTFKDGEVHLALGLIGIGKPWGVVPGEVPAEADVLRFLADAYQAGIRYFDTAASYGCSEHRLGLFLRELTPAERAGITIATKFGEHWDDNLSAPFVDHRFDALAASLERSLERLGGIDVLQLHKTSPEVLVSDDVERAWERARAVGVAVLGPSVSDLESARLAIESGRFQMLQLPLNRQKPDFTEAAESAERTGMWTAVNRPFAMGQIVVDAPPAEAHAERVQAFRFLLSCRFRGVILSGTRSLSHLRENLEAFAEARASLPPPLP